MTIYVDCTACSGTGYARAGSGPAGARCPACDGAGSVPLQPKAKLETPPAPPVSNDAQAIARLEELLVTALGPTHEAMHDWARVRMLLRERDRLHALVNSPQTFGFLEAVNAEKAHQIVRWGAPHDRSKSAEHWFWLVGYLAGKALRAAILGNKEKALHHCVSSAAALGNWFDAIKTDTTGSGIGADEDLARKDKGS